MTLRLMKEASRPVLQVFSIRHWHQLALTYSSRENFSAVCFVIAIAMALLDKPILSTPFFYYLVFLGVGVRFARIELRWTSEVALCLIIGASGIVATILSPLFDRNIFATAFLTSATILLIPLLFVKNTEKIFYAMIPLCYLQAILMTWQWFTQAIGVRSTGFVVNANAGSSLLLLGAIFLVTHTRYKWLAVPLLVAIPFSGSRWVLIVAAVVFALLFVSKHVQWRYLLAGITVAFILLFALQYNQVRAVYRIGGSDKPIANVGVDTKYRLVPPITMGADLLIPRGFIDSNLHNVPLRMSVETGLVSGAAWLAVVGLVLYRRPRYDYAWWMMLAVCLLSIMYYHTWIGPMGVFWWLLVSKLMDNTVEHPKAAVRRFWKQINRWE